MGYRHTLIITIFNSMIIFNNPISCIALAVPSSLSNLSWGDMDDFINFMRHFETSSRKVTQPRSSTLAKILKYSMYRVSIHDTD